MPEQQLNNSFNILYAQDFVPASAVQPQIEGDMDVNKTTLRRIFDYKPLKAKNGDKINESYEHLVQLAGALDVKIPRPVSSPIIRNKNTFVGVEIEIENTQTSYISQALGSSEALHAVQNCLFSGNAAWVHTHDDSLRNNGSEYITQIGLQAKDLPVALQTLELYLRMIHQKAQVNHRCGTHVHVDVADLTIGQFTNLVMIYTIFEDLFYRVSGDRYKNIYCVPVRASGGMLEPLFKVVLINKRPTYDQFRAVFSTFKKYMAFNMLPVGVNTPHHNRPLGTVEFRHHRGSSNPSELSLWVQLILDIHKAAQILSLEEIKELIFGLNSRANYYEFAAKVFGTAPSFFNYSRQDLMTDMYEGSAFLKEVYLNAKGI